MKVAGIIAEYNPFHNGHLHQIHQLKRIYQPDYIVVAMSGDFVQRGEPAILDKYARTRMALACGADLVLELPARYATASAEYFALGGTSLLESTGVVDAICFGAECEDLALLCQIADALKNPSDDFTALQKEYQKQGFSFPKARALTFKEVYHLPDETLSSPNNILAIEYLKATKLKPILVPRVGARYHQGDLSPLASATGIRNAIMQGHDYQTSMPKESHEILTQYLKQLPPVTADDFSSILGHLLLRYQAEGYEQFADCDRGLSRKIQNHLEDYTSFQQFAMLLKTKDLTYSRITRVLTHILLDIKKEDYRHIKAGVPYCRILGFKKEAGPLLSAIKKEATVPLITKVADASQLYQSDTSNANLKQTLQGDLFAAHCYSQVVAQKGNYPVPNEYRRGIIIEP